MSVRRSNATGTALIGCTLALGLLGACASDVPTEAPSSPDTAQVSIFAENQATGTSGWQLQLRADPDSLAVWASPYDAIFGDTLKVYIHSVHGNLKVGLYRLGWYQGLGGRLMLGTTLPKAQPQPACTAPFPGPVSCPWAATLQIPIEPDWSGGWYIVRVEDETHRTTSYPFVLRSRRQHNFLAVVPQFTWQAYNSFGGSSLYIRNPATGRAGPQVSFARPYIDAYNADPSQGTMGGTFDLRAVRWLERAGIDLGYASDLDLAGPQVSIPEPLKGIIFLGHDEYWTWDERTNVEALRDAGKHLMFLAANNAYWNVRSTSGDFTGLSGGILTSYKGLPDPGATTREETTVRFRDAPLNRPENGLYGMMFDGVIYSDNAAPLVVPNDSTLGPEGSAFVLAAGVHPGDTLGSPTSKEGDDVVANGHTPSGIQILLTATYPVSSKVSENHRTTFFIAPSGAGVFASGSNTWTRFLEGPEYNPRIAAITSAALAWMAAH